MELALQRIEPRQRRLGISRAWRRKQSASRARCALLSVPRWPVTSAKAVHYGSAIATPARGQEQAKSLLRNGVFMFRG
jgi:hypothetical protein